LVASWRARHTGAFRPRTIATQLGLGAAGLLLYAYVPLAARRDPALNWGAASGGERLFDHLLRAQYGGGGGAPLTPRLAFGADEVIGAWAPFAAPLLVAALLFATRVAGGCDLRRWLLLAIGTASLGGFLAIPFDVQAEVLRSRVAPTYLPAILCVAAGAGLGLTALEATLRARGPLLGHAPLVLFGLALVPSGGVLADATNRAGDDGARRYAQETLEACPPDAVLVLSRLGATDILSFPLLYLQQVEGRRTDVTLIDRSTLALAWYREQLAQRAPDLTPAVARLDATLASDPERFADPRQARLATVPFVRELVEGQRAVVMVERPGPQLVGEREPQAGPSLWWLNRDAPRSDRVGCWTWLAEQRPSVWVALFEELADERCRARE
ncbi:MAG: hypothetical protein AAFZ65_13065, partial [Planctomycetota bacterium]